MLHKILWTPQKIAQRLRLIDPLQYRKRHPIPAFRYKTLSSPLDHPPVGLDDEDKDWEVIEPFTYWGKWLTDFILKTQFEVPADWEKDKAVALYLPLGNSGDFSHPESLAYIDEEPYASADRHHQEIILPEKWRGGKTHQLALHGWTGLGGYGSNDPHTKLYMRECAVVQIDQPTRDFIAAARIALDVANRLNDNDPIKGRLYNALDAAFKVLDTRDPVETEVFYETVPAALETLQKGVTAAGSPLDVDIIGVGHAHIDVAWLWTLGQTRRKNGRTFSNVLRLMEQFPDFKFSQSQAQLYKYTSENYPQIFEGIKERVKEGRWEVMGGTWVEPDCNAIGAESLARQFILGRGYFHKHFGDVDTPVLWLPDTFGYSWALPQLIKQAGMKYFITHKMSWNQYNQMPNQILWWQGLDGTKILTHFLTTSAGDEYLPHATTYNAIVSVEEVLATWNNFRQKETHNELITAYGYGDGGGGPTREMVENIHTMANHPGAPRLRTGTIQEFMERIENDLSDDLPTWNGEFYLEYHRGTYTSQARTKRNNRKSEFLLHDAEFLAAWAALNGDYSYPKNDFDQAWELVCLNQFHDILPGSSIGPVYVDSNKDYDQIRELGENAREAAISSLASNIPAEASVIALNPTSFGGIRIGLLEETTGTGLSDLRSGKALVTQSVEQGTLVEIANLTPYSYVAIGSISETEAVSDETAAKVAQKGSGFVLENALIRVELGSNGVITRIYDKAAKREVLAKGATGNNLQAFEDRPMNYDAWDIDIYFEDRVEAVENAESVSIIEAGPLRAGVEIKRKYRSSEIVQKLYIYKGSQRIDFDTWIDWNEQHILLKAAFPVEVFSPHATFDVQWGNVERPTHRNTSWDWARFETCAQKWADLSEGNYGVALLNDCKYGYDIHDNVLRLSLLKSATMPDPHADQGEHMMTYSLLPHQGDWRTNVVSAAYDLNDPLILRRVSGGGAGKVTQGSSFVAVNKSNVVIETVKQAEDGQGIIVRLYENERNRGEVSISAGFGIKEAYHCNLLEENQTSLAVVNNQVALEMHPYQIATVRLIPA